MAAALRRLAAAWLLLLGAVCACAAAPDARRQAMAADRGIARSLASREAFVAVLVDRDDRRLLRSEAYGDWASYFEAFVARERGAFAVYVLPPRRAVALSRRLGRKLGNATCFVDARGAALVHDGLVLEPRVYEIGAGFLRRGVVDPQARSYGLVAVEPSR